MMTGICALLCRLFVQPLTQADRNVALKTQLAPINGTRDNVIHVDFKRIREAKEGACDHGS